MDKWSGTEVVVVNAPKGVGKDEINQCAFVLELEYVIHIGANDLKYRGSRQIPETQFVIEDKNDAWLFQEFLGQAFGLLTADGTYHYYQVRESADGQRIQIFYFK